MGDRTNMTVHMRNEDSDQVCSALEFKYPNKEDDPHKGWSTLNLDEVNHGGDSEIDKLRELHIPFFGEHGSGACYNAAKFACDGHAFARVETDYDGTPVVRYSNGEPNAEDVAQLDRYEEIAARLTNDKTLQCAMEHRGGVPHRVSLSEGHYERLLGLNNPVQAIEHVLMEYTRWLQEGPARRMGAPTRDLVEMFMGNNIYEYRPILAIVGSREYKHENKVRAFVRQAAKLNSRIIIMSGGARGVDMWAVHEAEKVGLDTKVIEAELVERADKVRAFWDGKSKGTRNTMERAKKAGKLLKSKKDFLTWMGAS